MELRDKNRLCKQPLTLLRFSPNFFLYPGIATLIIFVEKETVKMSKDDAIRYDVTTLDT